MAYYINLAALVVALIANAALIIMSFKVKWHRDALLVMTTAVSIAITLPSFFAFLNSINIIGSDILIQLMPIFISIGSGLFALAVYLLNDEVNSIKKLTKMVQEIASGNLNVEIDEELKETKNEIGDLAKAFDKMFSGIKSTTNEAVRAKLMRTREIDDAEKPALHEKRKKEA